MKTLSEQLACAKREFALRSNTYPKWIESKRMKPEAAQHEIECMTCIVMTLEKMIMLGEVSEEMKSEWRKKNPQKQCLCCGADIDKGTKCENCEDTPAHVAQADLI